MLRHKITKHETTSLEHLWVLQNVPSWASNAHGCRIYTEIWGLLVTQTEQKNSSTSMYVVSLKSWNCTHHKELHEGEVNTLPTDATVPSRNKINFITT